MALQTDTRSPEVLRDQFESWELRLVWRPGRHCITHSLTRTNTPALDGELLFALCPLSHSPEALPSPQLSPIILSTKLCFVLRSGCTSFYLFIFLSVVCAFLTVSYCLTLSYFVSMLCLFSLLLVAFDKPLCLHESMDFTPECLSGSLSLGSAVLIVYLSGL